MVRPTGIEPVSPEGRQILSLLSLPISPRPHGKPGIVVASVAGSKLHDIRRKSDLAVTAGNNVASAVAPES